MDVKALYGALAEGDGDGDLPPHTAGRLLRFAMDAVRSPADSDRLGALRVAAALPTAMGVRITEMLVNDASLVVRQQVLRQGIAAQYDGLPVLRSLASDPDPGLASEALDLLVRAVDLQSTPTARRLLRSPLAPVRARAATLLGHVGGKGVQGELRRLEADDDEDVRTAAAEALQRVLGELPRDTPSPWWEPDAEPDLPAPPPELEGSFLPAVPPATEEILREPTAPPAPAAAPPASAPEDTLEEPRAEEEWSPLPSTMPTEARALLKLLGMVSPDDQGAVLKGIEDVDIDTLSEIISFHNPGGDWAIGRGCGIAARALGRKVWMSSVRRLVFDPDHRVRAGAAEAIGALTGPSGVPSLTMLLGDPAGLVRRSALSALAELCENIGRADIAQQWAQKLGADPDPRVREVASTVAAARSPN